MTARRCVLLFVFAVVVAGQYLIARNDEGNPGDVGRWTRIDWAPLSGMAPYTWAFCLSAYDAATAGAAEATQTARRDNLRTGCGGFPFSRMKRVRPLRSDLRGPLR